MRSHRTSRNIHSTRPSRYALTMLLVILLALSAAAVAQSEHTMEGSQSNATSTATQNATQNANQTDATKKASPAPKSEAQMSFATIKSLAGEWEGQIETDFPGAKEALEKSGGLHVTMRVTSRGNVLVHEFQEIGTLLDATKYDHPVTMVYVDQDQLNLIHYCDAGNRPKMLGKLAPDGKTVAFDFAELSGSNRFGHMHQAAFTVVDKDHHVEEWLFMLKGKDGKEIPVHARFNLHRVSGPIAGAASGGAQ